MNELGAWLATHALKLIVVGAVVIGGVMTALMQRGSNAVRESAVHLVSAFLIGGVAGSVVEYLLQPALKNLDAIAATGVGWGAFIGIIWTISQMHYRNRKYEETHPDPRHVSAADWSRQHPDRRMSAAEWDRTHPPSPEG